MTPLQRIFHPRTKTIRVEGPQEVEGKVRHQVPGLLKKAKGDEPQAPPNYRPAVGQVNSCASCKNFDAGSSVCNKFHTPVSALYVCDAWEGDQQKATFKVIDLPKMPDLGPVKMSAMHEVKEACARLRKQAGNRHLNVPLFGVATVLEKLADERATAILAALTSADPESELNKLLPRRTDG